MKKKLLSFIFTLCLIIPAMFYLTACKEEKVESKSSIGLIFELINNNTEYSVAGIGQCRDVDLIIPSSYNGKTVTEISDNAFKDCDVIMSVIIPNSIKEIGMSAFENCSYLEKVLLSDKLIEIDSHAFEDCTSLVEIIIPESVETICWNAFTNCSKLKSVFLEKTEYWYHG